jgi:cobalt-zinc-cadmium efflux system protein
MTEPLHDHAQSSEHGHHHAHGHPHFHPLHGEHPHGAGSAQATLRVGLILTTCLLVVEVVAAGWSHSLALLADAGHVLTDMFALGLSWYALRQAERPPDTARTFGYHRSQILVALLNSTSLLLIAAYILHEAVGRFRVATPIEEGSMLGAGLLALLVNLYLGLRLHGAHGHDLNVRSAWLHVVGDALASLGVVVTAIVLGFNASLTWLDPLVGVGISLLIAGGAWRVVREAAGVLMEGVPKHLDPEAIVTRLCRLDGVEAVHDLHVWSLKEGLELLSCHLVVHASDIVSTASLLRAAQEVLAQDFGILHATLQPEWEPCALPHAVCTLAEASKTASQPQARGTEGVHGKTTPKGRDAA